MGIEQFFSSIEKNKITNHNFATKLEKQIEVHNLFIDFNSIVYINSANIINDLNFILLQLIKSTTNIDDLLHNYNIVLNSSDKITEYLSLLSTDKIEQIILKGVQNYLVNIVTNYVYPDKLKYLFIALDGVPSKSKIMEQKKRRYMGFFISKIEELIFEKYYEELKNDKVRYTFEKNKIKWNVGSITPGSIFMQKLDAIINDTIHIIRKKCTNLIDCIFSDSNQYSEGEKKIINYMYQLASRYEDELVKWTIYSPDSDVTLLALLFYSYFDKNNFKISIMRHNQQKHFYNIININNLGDNIFKYVKEQLDEVVKSNVIDDIVFLLTIFGNDFLPKIESFNVRNDFQNLINYYIEIFKNNKEYLILGKAPNKKINSDIFTKVIQLLSSVEKNNLQDMYASNNYRGYDKLKKILGIDSKNFTGKLNEFLENLRKFNNDIKNSNDIKNISNVWSNEFIENLIKLTKLGSHEHISHSEFIKLYLDYYKSNKLFPVVSVLTNRYRKSLKQRKHREILENRIESLGFKVTKYDEEIYKFQNMLDEYSKKLNAYSLNLGYIKVNDDYSWYSESISKGVKRYYKEFFDADIDTDKFYNIIDEYMSGLSWVFQYYYNTNFSQNYIWYYPYTHAPLLHDINTYLNKVGKDYLNNTFDKPMETVIVEDFFSPIEHLLYTSVAPYVMNIIPIKYHEIVNYLKDYYPDMTKIIHNFWISTEPSEIDCRGAIYLAKCHAKYMNMTSFEDDKKFIKIIREKSNITGGNMTLYKQFKKKYLLNKNQKDKELYKFFKKTL